MSLFWINKAVLKKTSRNITRRNISGCFITLKYYLKSLIRNIHSHLVSRFWRHHFLAIGRLGHFGRTASRLFVLKIPRVFCKQKVWAAPARCRGGGCNFWLVFVCKRQFYTLCRWPLFFAPINPRQRPKTWRLFALQWFSWRLSKYWWILQHLHSK